MEGRTLKLKRNFKVLFWMQAIRNVKISNIIIALFYLSRHLTPAQLFYLPIIFSITALLTEVPSSYMADLWGRKKTLMLSSILYALYFVIYIFAPSFWWFAIGTIIYSTAFSFYTGTDEALLYDTNKELGLEAESLKKVGAYFSAQRIFKIAAPIVGVLLASNLTDHQFILVFALDAIIAVAAIILGLFLTEANHRMDLHKQEAGVILDAYNLLKNNSHLARAIFNRMLVFIASLTVWVYFQPFFTSRGLPIVTIGVIWGVYNLFGYLANNIVHRVWLKYSEEFKINFLNYLYCLIILIFIICYYIYPQPFLLFVLFVLSNFVEIMRWPFFSVIFNRESHSYNRATTLSLTNFVKSALDIPFLFIGSILIAKSEIFPYILSAAIGLAVILFFSLKKYHGNFQQADNMLNNEL